MFHPDLGGDAGKDQGFNSLFFIMSSKLIPRKMLGVDFSSSRSTDCGFTDLMWV
jgi:hypothetical protein